MKDSAIQAGPVTSVRRFSVAVALKALLFAAFGLVGAWLLLTGKSDPITRPPESARPPIVDVIAVATDTRSLPVRTQGTVEPLTRVALVAQVGGIVESVSDGFRDGGFFAAGDTLLQIERDDYEFAIARAESAVAGGEQRLAEERGRALQAEREWRDLGESDANDLFLRKPQIKAAEAALKAAHADLAAAELALARTSVRAPFAGRIETRRADLGQYVAPGAPLVEVYATDTMEVRLPLTDSQLALLELPGLDGISGLFPEVILTSRFGGKEWLWPAVIRRTEAQVDRTNRVMYAIAEIDMQGLSTEPSRPPLSPGTFVVAEISGRPMVAVAELPATALRPDNTVLVVTAEGMLERVPVSVTLRQADRVWVTGLERGINVVAEQSSNLVSGAFVDIAKVLTQPLAAGAH